MNFSSDSEVIDSFINETIEHLDKIEFVLLSLEKASNIKEQDGVNSIFRSAHSIKAGANLLNFSEIEISAHKLESSLDILRKNKEVLLKSNFNTLLIEIDKIRDLIDKINF